MAKAKKKVAGRRTPSRGRKRSRLRASAKRGRHPGRRTAGARTRPSKRKAVRKKTKRSTGTAEGAVSTRRPPALERERRQLRDIEEPVPGPPSSLNLDQHGSAARTGRAELRQARREHTETSPAMTGGDVDADWEDAYAVGDEAPGGDNPTPDQDRVDDIGRAIGVEYADNEELKASDKIAERDRHRWELDPASSEDYKDRTK